MENLNSPTPTNGQPMTAAATPNLTPSNQQQDPSQSDSPLADALAVENNGLGTVMGDGGAVGAPAVPGPIGNGNVGAELSGTARPVQRHVDYIDSPELFIRPPSFEQRMGATIQAAAISTEGAGKSFAMSFRLVLEHAFHAHFPKFAGSVSDFETNVRMHIEELFTRGKETGGYLK